MPPSIARGIVVAIMRDLGTISRQLHKCLLCLQLTKRLADLKKEKEVLVLQVEQEEELLTNTLQKKLRQVHVAIISLEGFGINSGFQVLKEKVDLENQVRKRCRHTAADLHSPTLLPL